MTRNALVVASALLLVACSGGSTLGGDGGASEGGSPDGGGNPSDGGTEGGAVCTPGAYVFCRCADRSEGTKQCRADGLSFDACTAGTGPCP